MEDETNIKKKITWMEILKIIIASIGVFIVIITVARFLYFDRVSVKFNKNYILCYRDTSFGPNEVKKYSKFDSITLNFALMNNNPVRNYFVGNLYLYISENENILKDLIRGREVSEDLYLFYHAQYIFNNFDWQDVKKYINKGSYQVLAIPSNDVEVFNIEFYPKGWTEDDVGRNRYNLQGNKTYYILLFHQDQNGKKEFLNKNSFYSIYVNQDYINELMNNIELSTGEHPESANLF